MTWLEKWMKRNKLNQRQTAELVELDEKTINNYATARGKMKKIVRLGFERAEQLLNR